MQTTALLRRAALLGAAASVLTGCFRFESSFDIGDDGTADVEVVTAVDVAQLGEIGDLLGQDLPELGDLSGEELVRELTEGADPCADLTGTLVGYEATTREIDEGDVRGVGCTIEDVPIEELTGIGGGSALTITQSEDETTFELRLGGVSDLTAATQEIPIPGFEIDDLFEVRVNASAPGSVDAPTATETSGSTATWVITQDAAFVEDDTAVMAASWSPDGVSDSDWVIVLVIALVVVGALVVAGLLLLPRLRPGPDAYVDESGTADPPFPAGAPTSTPAAGTDDLPPAPRPPDVPPPPPGPPSGPPTPPAPPPPDGSGGPLPPPPRAD
jgi:hypothetical protein